MNKRRVAVLSGIVVACALSARSEAPQPLPVLRQSVAALPACRHNEVSSTSDRERREQAIVFAKAIHLAQASSVRITGRYQRLEDLVNLPERPRDFDVRLYVDARGYMFSLKDTRDPCRYGIFSDQSGFLYEKSPQNPLIANP